jgi:hypothetical protein
MRIRLLKTRVLGTLLAGLACLSFFYGEEAKPLPRSHISQPQSRPCIPDQPTCCLVERGRATVPLHRRSDEQPIRTAS